MKTKVLAALMLLITGTTLSCSPGFQPIQYGQDACDHCKMTILDERFAAEVVTAKGKAFKFDDIVCMKQYIHSENLEESDLLLFVSDFSNPRGSFLNAKEAYFLHGEFFKSPMSGNYAAFPDGDAASGVQEKTISEMVLWEHIK